MYGKIFVAALGLLVLFIAPVPLAWFGLVLLGAGLYSVLDDKQPWPRFGLTALAVLLAAGIRHQMGVAATWVFIPQAFWAIIVLAALVAFLFLAEYLMAAVTTFVLVMMTLVSVEAVADFNGGFPDLSRGTPEQIAFPPQNRTPRPALRVLPNNPAGLVNSAPNAKPPGFDEEGRRRARNQAARPNGARRQGQPSAPRATTSPASRRPPAARGRRSEAEMLDELRALGPFGRKPAR